MIEYQSYSTILDTPFGKLGLIIDQAKLTKVDFLPDSAPLKTSSKPEIKKIAAEIKAYLKNPQHTFSCPHSFQGTPFQQKVWRALTQIPAGQTLTYGQLAKKLKSGPRAIGQACRTNPLPILIPCHRVVAANSLGGFAGTTKGGFFAAKCWLLKHEGWIN